ncbi:GNAT family N-acetyltransferase [Variovorax sp. R-27]|uniref:GNAT family N-acetyltransferase n=1 Tax=Variovorax sp. R-27 TaxID=3404058 RepID=UPI003CF328FF
MAQRKISASVKEVIAGLLQQGEKTPFYFLDLNAIEGKAKEFQRLAFLNFEKCEIAYSIKTNNLRSLLQIFNALGWSAEAASLAEIKAAVADGFSLDRIIFDGPVKGREEIEFALKNGIRIHADSLEELRAIIETAGLHQISVPCIGIRLTHFGKKMGASRFGFDRKELEQVAELTNAGRFLLGGVHLHVGSNMLDESSLKEALVFYAEFINSHLPETGWIDLGGGYPANSASTFLEISTIESYLRGISQCLAELIDKKFKLKIILEPGRHLVEDDGYLVSTISHEKSRNGRRILFCDASVNQAFSIHSWAHRLEPILERPQQARKSFYLSGANCFESDYLGGVHEIDSETQAGDAILIRGCGAYDIPSATAWIRPAIPIWGVAGKNVILLRHRVSEGKFRSLDVSSINSFPLVIAIEEGLELRAIARGNASVLHCLIEKNKSSLSQQLHWPRFVDSLEDTISFCISCEIGMQNKVEAAYGIWCNDHLVGVVSFNTLDLGNESGEIGYWLDESARGKGVASSAVGALVRTFAQQQLLRRYVIKCAVTNKRSQRVAERLGFSREGLLKLAEKIGDTRHDQHLYALSLQDGTDLPAFWTSGC